MCEVDAPIGGGVIRLRGNELRLERLRHLDQRRRSGRPPRVPDERFDAAELDRGRSVLVLSEQGAQGHELDRVPDRVLHIGDAGARLMGGFQHVRTNLLLVADIFVDRKHREQPVAHVFQHVAAVLLDRGDLAIEITVQNVHDGLGR